MPNFREKTISGKRYVRCPQVSLHNPLGSDRYAVLHSELVTQAGSQEPQTRALEPFVVPFSAGGSITLIDPATDAPTGQTMTHAELYQAVYSLYRQEAAARGVGADL